MWQPPGRPLFWTVFNLSNLCLNRLSTIKARVEHKETMPKNILKAYWLGYLCYPIVLSGNKMQGGKFGKIFCKNFKIRLKKGWKVYKCLYWLPYRKTNLDQTVFFLFNPRSDLMKNTKLVLYIFLIYPSESLNWL